MKLLFSLLLLLCFPDHGVSGVDTDEVSVMEGDSVTLHTGVEINQQDRIRWYYNDTRIAQINRDLSYICTDVKCNEGTERFKGRLKLDHQTGSLTITNTTNTDSGEYQLQINSSRFIIIRSFSVSVTAVPGSGLSSAAVGGICAAVVLFVAGAAAVIYYLHRSKGNWTQRDDHQEIGVPEAVGVLNPAETTQVIVPNGTSTTGTERSLMAADNEIPQ